MICLKFKSYISIEYEKNYINYFFGIVLFKWSNAILLLL